MDFRLLGEFEIAGNAGLLRLAARKQRALLALLCLHAGETLSRDYLINQLWERPPEHAGHALEVHVSRLRKALAALEGTDGLLVSRPGGYALVVDREHLDLARAEQLVSEGHAALATGDATTAAERLAEALALWRGEPLPDLAFEPFAQVELARLQELRLGALEGLAEARLQLGRHAEIVPELEPLLARYPLRERPRGLLMLALYRCGRQAEALDLYGQGRRLLVDELGIEPSTELQQLQQRILRHDPSLAPVVEMPPPKATPPPEPPPSTEHEQRKVVSVLFCDLTGSTALGEQLDPEALRSLLGRYFERMKTIVETYGGTVEKYIGDAVMAVFGVPRLHDDDAVRACRAAIEMRDALPELGIEARIGIATGEVFAGTAERLVTGDAVNVAARLEQSAAPGEILVGEATVALARSAVEVAAVEPLPLRGKAAPVPAFRLVSVSEAPEQGAESRFVGRRRERAAIEEAWRRARAERRCELLTVVGEAGVGKSRLVAEALAGFGARVVHGRCLPYGDGITYWPVVSVLKQLDATPSDPAAAAAIRSLLRQGEPVASAEEIAWAFRKLLEEQAPLVVVFDDIHAGEQTFLDLVEGAALLSGGAPILLVCMARPELVERRPQWPVALRLDPLAADAVAELIGDRVPAPLRERIAQAAGGNPLFVLEMLAVAEQAQGDVAVPATLRALLAARLDQLDEPERRLLERAAVEGEIFHRGALQELTGDDAQLTPLLASLTRKQLIRPERAQLPGEDGFRFRHVLVRDAAYDALPKGDRARLHQRFAAWLQEHGQALVELDEILGHHLEQAARYLAELDRPDPQLADRAGTRLAAAGRRALWRDDHRTAALLLQRALTLTRPLRLDVHLELDLADAVGRRNPLRAVTVAEAAARRARDAGDDPGRALALVVAAHYGFVAGDVELDELEALAGTALPLLEQADDHAGLVHVWFALGYMVANTRCRYEDMAEATEQQLRHARLAGRRSEQNTLGLLAFALDEGPRPAGEALREVDERLSEHPVPRTLLRRARLLAMLGRLDEARQLATQASTQACELVAGDPDEMVAVIAILAGDHESAARHLRRTCNHFEQQAARALLSTYAPMLGRELCALGRYDEAEPLAQTGRDLGDRNDARTQMLWRQTQALVHAHHGRHAQAEQLAREAVEISERTDALTLQGDALSDLAHVLETAGRTREAITALHEALDRYERKQNIPHARRTRERLAALETRRPHAAAVTDSR